MRNISGGDFTASRNLEIREGDVLCTTLPLFHTNALGAFHHALLSGSTLVAEPRFSASRFWQSLIERRATVTYLLGAMVPILLSRAAVARRAKPRGALRARARRAGQSARGV